MLRKGLLRPDSRRAGLWLPKGRSMGTYLIDKLLQTVVKRKASDLHITVGPAAGAADRRPHEEAGDEGAGAGGHGGPDEEHRPGAVPAGVAGGRGRRLRFRLRRPGPLPRVDLQAAGVRGHGAAADPGEVVELHRPGNAGGIEGPDLASAGVDSGDRADGLGQDDHAGGDGRLPQRQRRSPHHHHRGPDRVLSPAQEVDDQPAGDRRGRAQLSPRRSGGRCAWTPT